jgi:hypothetical protein
MVFADEGLPPVAQDVLTESVKLTDVERFWFWVCARSTSSPPALPDCTENWIFCAGGIPLLKSNWPLLGNVNVGVHPDVVGEVATETVYRAAALNVATTLIIAVDCGLSVILVPFKTLVCPGGEKSTSEIWLN